jgi:hypothetical protein
VDVRATRSDNRGSRLHTGASAPDERPKENALEGSPCKRLPAVDCSKLVGRPSRRNEGQRNSAELILGYTPDILRPAAPRIRISR